MPAWDGLFVKSVWAVEFLTLHTLRHSHASQLLSAGVPLAAVSKRLGHSSVYVTATIYSHALSKDEVAAATVWDEIAKAAKISRAQERLVIERSENG